MAKSKNNQTLDVNETIAQSEAFILKNKKWLLSVIIGLVVVIGGYFVSKYYYFEPRAEKASTVLSLGQQYFTAGDYDKALNGDGKDFPGYVNISKEYKCTDAANLAHLYAGICYAKQEKYPEAIAELESFSPQDDQTISPAALGTLANCYANNEQIDEAIETFKEAADLADNASLSPVFLLNAGMLLESLNKNEEALAVYEQIKNDYPTGVLSRPGMQMDKVISPEIDKYIERASK